MGGLPQVTAAQTDTVWENIDLDECALMSTRNPLSGARKGRLVGVYKGPGPPS